MFDKEAIHAIHKGAGIIQASDAISDAFDAGRAVTALPNEFGVHDLEKYMANRRRARGSMETSCVRDFAGYAIGNKEEGAAVFVSPKSMVANAVLNLGTPDNPGHADNRAQFNPRATAAFTALNQVANGQALEQQRVAEFLEDWAHCIDCFHESQGLAHGKAVSAVRNITIEGLRKVEASEQQLSASKSAFEQVTASSKDTLPTHIYFKCEPYQGFAERTFVMRLGIRTSDKPAITLRIINRELHDEQMSEELKAKVLDAIDAQMPVFVGDYTAK
jgi:uncharacterized protein YfdQ (DUF2303 family)